MAETWTPAWMRAKESLWSGVSAVVAACGVIAGLWFEDKVPRTYSVPLALLGLLGLLVSLVWKHRSADAEVTTERREHEARVRLMPADVLQVNPLDLDIDPAAPTELGAARVPTYVARDQDSNLRRAIEDGLAGRGSHIVLVVGAPKVGKSRSLFEALRWVGERERLCVIAPRTAADLKAIVRDGHPAPSGGRPILWLGDIEPRVNEGLTREDIAAWLKHFHGLAVGTRGGKVLGLSEPDPRFVTALDELVKGSELVHLQTTTSHEVAEVATGLSESARADLARYGLAAYLMAGPLVEAKLSTGQHRGQPRDEVGLLLVRILAAWRRAGRADPLARSTLHHLAKELASPLHKVNDAWFESGLRWLTAPVADGTVAIATELAEGVEPLDLAMRFVDSEDLKELTPIVRASAIETATPDEALPVAIVAYLDNDTGQAKAAFARASESAVATTAATGLFGLALSQSDLNDFVAALATAERIEERYGTDPSPELRVQVANALVNKAVHQERAGDLAGALATAERIEERYGTDPSPELRVLVAKALYNKALHQERAGDLAGALATAERIEERYGTDPSPELRVQVANALVNKAVHQAGAGDLAGALATAERIEERYGTDPSPELRVLVAKALYNKAVHQERAGDLAGALATAERIEERYGTDPSPELRVQVAKALYNKALHQERAGDLAGALRTAERIEERYGTDPSPELRVQVAKALYNKALHQAGAGDLAGALRTAERIEERYGTDPSPELRVQVAKALYNKAVHQERAGDLAGALATAERIEERYGTDPDPELANVLERTRRLRDHLLGSSSGTPDSAAGAGEPK